MGGAIGERERDAVAFAHGEVGYCLQVFSVHGNGGAQNGQVGAGNGAHATPDVRYPWDCPAVVEAQGKLHAQGKFSTKALDDADDMRVTLANRHEVNHADRSISMGESGFENQCVSAIAARGFPFAFGRGDLPVAVFFRADESGKAGLRGKIGPAEPVDGAVFVDQSGGFAIADQGVVFDFCSHGCGNFGEVLFTESGPVATPKR